MKRIVSAALVCAFVMSASFAASPFEISRGDLKLVLYPDSGSFSLYKLSDVGKNRYESLFEDRDASATSWFSVLSNGRVFKLTKKVGKPIGFEETPDGAKFIFTLTDDFQAEQEFSFTTASPSGSEPVVLVETRIENTSGKKGSYALKAFIDTTLGENEGIHFYTDIRNRISAETRLQSGIDRDAWLVSKNQKLALSFLRTGTGLTVPQTIYIANWDRLNTLAWLPEVAEGRSFNTLYSINDSAVLIVWPERDIDPNEKMSIRMIIGAWAGNPGEYLQDGRTTDTPSGREFADPEKLKNRDYREKAIKDLLDRIAVIEANPDSVSEEALARLNAELDFMLKSGE